MYRKLIIPLVAAAAASTQVQAQSPDLEAPFAVKSGGEVLDLGETGHADPLFIDWDNDGLKDLVTGQFGLSGQTEGAIRVYKNVGTAKAPKFDGFTYVKADDGNTLLIPTG